MKYYTKEWYSLMQKQYYTADMKKVPDKIYTDKEIQELYDKQLKKEIMQEKKAYNTPPTFTDLSDLLKPDTFDPDIWSFVDESTGTYYHPQTLEEAKRQLQTDREQANIPQIAVSCIMSFTGWKTAVMKYI